MFRKAGRVLHTDIDTDPDTGQPLGSGLVIYDDPRDARAALGTENSEGSNGILLTVML